jgi:Cys-tRNA(Pro) deacylase
MDGTHEVSTKTLARLIGTKTVSPVDEKRAEQLTGYQVGGISPFGTRTAMPVYLGEHLLERATIFVNGGKRGFLVELSPQDLQRLLSATAVDMAVSR